MNTKEHRGTWTRSLVLISGSGIEISVGLTSDENGNLELMPNDEHNPPNHWVWKIDLEELEAQLNAR